MPVNIILTEKRRIFDGRRRWLEKKDFRGQANFVKEQSNEDIDMMEKTEDGREMLSKMLSKYVWSMSVWGIKAKEGLLNT